MKTIVFIIPETELFLSLIEPFIKKSSKIYNVIIIGEIQKTTGFFFRDRIKKKGFFRASNEFLYLRYESIFNHWSKAEKALLKPSNLKYDRVFESLKSAQIYEYLRELNADILISCGSNYIPKIILDLFKLKLNIHPGILPEYPGAGSPDALCNKDYANIGYTIHSLTPKIDAGEIFLKENVDIENINKKFFAFIYIKVYQMALEKLNFVLLKKNAFDYAPVLNNNTNKAKPFLLLSKYFSYRLSTWIFQTN